MNKKNTPKVSVGLDIGTTTIGAAVLEPGSGQVLKTFTLPNDAAVPSEHAWEHLQDPVRILEKAAALLDGICDAWPVSSVGVTGQMHGILFTGADGSPLSPLYTWQDTRAGRGENSACERIRRETRYRVPEGYGLATLYHLLLEGRLPPGTAGCCTVMDFVTMKLCRLPHPVTHITNAASWGFYREDTHGFDAGALRKLGIPCGILPAVTAEGRIIGEYRGIPVAAAIGDSQAAFIGSVEDPAHTVLVNIGTGSQVSMLSDRPLEEESPQAESRPFDGKRYMLSASCLCGGRAYALLASFFGQYAAALGLPDGPRYDVLNRLAAEGLEQGNVLPVRTTFCGTRADPALRGQITGIGEENLTPAALAAGVLCGMADELYGLYRKMPSDGVTVLTASGNAVRKNPVLQRILAEKFGLPLQLPPRTEEAACGAAIFAARAAGSTA